MIFTNQNSFLWWNCITVKNKLGFKFLYSKTIIAKFVIDSKITLALFTVDGTAPNSARYNILSSTLF